MNLPSATHFVERLPEMTKKGDRHKTKGHRHVLAACDACGEVTYIRTDRSEPLGCRMTPRCGGHHRKTEGET